MAGQDHKTRIEIKIDDSDARASVEYIVAQLQKAQDLATNLSMGALDPSAAAGGQVVPGGHTTSTQKEAEKEADSRRGGGGVSNAVGVATQTAAGLMGVRGGNAGVQAIQAMIDGMGKAAGLMKDGLPPILSHFVALSGAAARLIGEGVSARVGVLQERAALEPSEILTRNIAGYSPGTGGTFRKATGTTSGVGMGFMPGQAAGVVSSYMGAYGLEGKSALGVSNARIGMGRMDPFTLTREGIDPSTYARLLGGAVTGGGGGSSFVTRGGSSRSRVTGLQMMTGAKKIGQDTRITLFTQAVEAAEGAIKRMGLRVGQASQALGVMVQAQGLLASVGGVYDMGEAARFLGSDVGQAQKLNTTRLMGGLSNQGAALTQEFGGMFGGLTDMAMKSAVFSSADSPEQAMKMFQNLGGSPVEQMNILRSTLGDTEMGRLALMSQYGLSSDAAKAFLSGNIDAPLDQAQTGGDIIARRATAKAGAGRSRTFARAKQRLLDEADKGDTKALVNLATQIQITIMGLSTKADSINKALLTLLKWLKI